MSDLPHNWCTTKLGELIKFKYGKALPDRVRSGSGFPVYGSNGIVGYHNDALTNGITIIIGRKGSVGEIHYSDIPCSPIDTTYYIDEIPGDVPRYWFYQLKILRLSELNRATAIPGLNRMDAYNQDILLAPLREQKRIADKLDAILARVDACRERLDRIPSILKRFRQAVLAAATSGKLTEDWRNINNRNMLQWAQLTIGQLITGIEAGLNVQCIERPPKADEQGLVKISAVTWGRYNDAESKTLPLGKDVPEATRIRKGDFLISRANTLELVGACVIVDNVLRPVFLSDKILRLVMPGHIKSWLLYTLRSPAGRRQIETLASGNQLSMRNLSQASLRSITIPMPPDDERKEIVRRIESLFAYADRLEARYAAARIQVDKLIPATLAKAFRGELVPRDPDDVPANVLLERILAAAESPATKRGRSKSVNSTTGS